MSGETITGLLIGLALGALTIPAVWLLPKRPEVQPRRIDVKSDDKTKS